MYEPASNTVAALEERLRVVERERAELASALETARAALRAREEMLGGVIHDLRNPLGTITMGATALLQIDPAHPAVQRVHTIAERMQRQGDRMTRQIANLADLVEIGAGRLVIDRGSHAPAAILATAGEQIAPLARERSVGFEIARTELVTIDCDDGRVVQALVELACATIKGARGGGIEIGVQAAPGAFYVRNQGARAVQAGERGDIVTSLGFALARGIAEAHGGRIWIERSATAMTTWLGVSAAADDASRSAPR